MISDAERREVARRLRELEVCCLDGEFIDCGEVEDALGLVSDDGAWYEAGGVQRLADLIEPSEPEVKYVAEVKVDGWRLEELAHDAAVELTGIDRDVLLEEVNELEKCAYYFGLDFDEDEPLRDRLKEAVEDFAGCASRIREALGVES